MKLLIFMFALLPLIAFSQTFTFGVQGGVPVQTARGQTYSMPFVLGPSVGIRILPRLSLETGLQYRRIGREYSNFAFLFPENSVTLGFQSWRGSALEVPALAKYRFLGEGKIWRPFLSAGPTVRRTSITSVITRSVFSTSPVIGDRLPVVNNRTTHWNVDPTFGAGVDLKTGRFHIEPGVRYSYWGAGKTGGVRKNQTNFLLGFRF